MNNSYDRIEAVADLLFQVSNILKPIDSEISLDYLNQSKEFLDLLPSQEVDYTDKEKTLFKQLILG